MFDVRVHARVSAEATGTAELLAAAAAVGGRPARVLAEPDSGASAGQASPAVTHCVIGDNLAAGRRGQVDGLIVQDPGLLARVNVFDGVGPETYVLVNSAQGFGDLGLSRHVEGLCRDRLMIVPAVGLKTVQQDGPLLSAMMAGGFAALAGVLDLAAVVAAIQDCYGRPAADGCAAAARAAHEFVRTQKQAMVGA